MSSASVTTPDPLSTDTTHSAVQADDTLPTTTNEAVASESPFVGSPLPSSTQAALTSGTNAASSDYAQSITTLPPTASAPAITSDPFVNTFSSQGVSSTADFPDSSVDSFRSLTQQIPSSTTDDVSPTCTSHSQSDGTATAKSPSSDSTTASSSSSLSSSSVLPTVTTTEWLPLPIELAPVTVNIPVTVTQTSVFTQVVVKHDVIFSAMMIPTTIPVTQSVTAWSTVPTTVTQTATIVRVVEPPSSEPTTSGSSPSGTLLSDLSGKHVGLPDVFNFITAGVAVILCFLICFVLYKRAKERKEYERRISELTWRYA